MPRRPRIVIPGVAHHVVQRGSRKQQVFFSDEDRLIYLDMLRHYVFRNKIEVLAYCLMINHSHFALVPSTHESLSNAIGTTHMRYAQMVNAREGWTGHLWQERFFSCPMDEDYMWTAIRYIERNPVRAGLVKHAAEYQWSSARAHCGMSDDPLLTKDPKWVDLLSQKNDWCNWLSSEDDEHKVQNLLRMTRMDLPCGNESFLSQWEQKLGVSLRPKKRGRPKKEEIIHKVIGG